MCLAYWLIKIWPSMVRNGKHFSTLQWKILSYHYDDVIMSAMASQITSPTFVYSSVYSGTVQRKHQTFASLAFVKEIHRWPVNPPHKWLVTRKMFPYDYVIVLDAVSLEIIFYIKSPVIRLGKVITWCWINIKSLPKLVVQEVLGPLLLTRINFDPSINK